LKPGSPQLTTYSIHRPAPDFPATNLKRRKYSLLKAGLGNDMTSLQHLNSRVRRYCTWLPVYIPWKQRATADGAFAQKVDPHPVFNTLSRENR
jgi:hypothetical protein